MTTPTDVPIEDRLRAHFADRTATMAIPGPEHDTRLADVRAGRPFSAGRDDELHRRRGSGRRRRGPLLAAAAAVVAIALVAGVVFAGRDEAGDDVRTDPSSLPSTTETPPSTEAPPTTAVPEEPEETTVPEPVAPPSEATGPIVVGDGILGTWDGAGWVSWRAGDPVPAEQDYQLVELGAAPRVVRGTAGVDCSPEGAPSVDVGLDAGLGVGGSGIAVAGGHVLVPRPVEVVGSGDAYVDAARRVAASLGVTDPAPVVRQVIRADLDGDGTTEALVVAGRGSTDPGAAVAGDWSTVFLLRVVGGAAEPTVLDSNRFDPSSEGYPPAIEHYEIDAVADVNGDGSLEVAVAEQFWENRVTRLFEATSAGALTEVLSVSCGV